MTLLLLGRTFSNLWPEDLSGPRFRPSYGSKAGPHQGLNVRAHGSSRTRRTTKLSKHSPITSSRRIPIQMVCPRLRWCTAHPKLPVTLPLGRNYFATWVDGGAQWHASYPSAHCPLIER